MRTFVIAAALVGLLGCASGRWVKTDATDVEARKAYQDCELRVVTSYGGWAKVEPFTASASIRECMNVQGYTYQLDR